MRVLITKEQLKEIGKKAFEDMEWLSYVKEYPNLRGVFSERWGSSTNPDQQLQTFIDYFLTEQEVLFFVLLKQNRVILRDRIREDELEAFLKSDPLHKERLLKIYPFLNDKSLTDITLFLNNKYEKLHSILFTLGADKKMPTILQYLDPNDIDKLYEEGFLNHENVIYTQEFVKFYLKHVKVLSRNEIFQICQKIGQDLVRDYHREYYNSCKKEWEYFKDKWDLPGFEVFKQDMFKRKKPSFHQYLINKSTSNVLEWWISEMMNVFDLTDLSTYKQFDLMCEYFSNVLITKFDRAVGGHKKRKMYFRRNLTDEDFEWISRAYHTTRPDDFILSHRLILYSLPRGGLEILSIFMYANNIDKSSVPAISQFYFPLDEIYKQIDKLAIKIQTEDNKEDLVKELGELKEIISNLLEGEYRPAKGFKPKDPCIMEEGFFRSEMAHDEIYSIFMIDDYFASGQNLWLMFTTLYEHFLKEIDMVDNMFPIAISKRRNLGRNNYPVEYIAKLMRYKKRTQEDMEALIAFESIFDHVYYGIQTEDVQTMYLIFPKIKRILSGDRDNVLLSRKRIKFNDELYSTEAIFFECKDKPIDKEWIDNLTITVVFPHAIADGKTEELLRMLYGERFRHSIRERIRFLSSLVRLAYMNRTKE